MFETLKLRFINTYARIVAAYECLKGKPTIFNCVFTDVVRIQHGAFPNLINNEFRGHHNKSQQVIEYYPKLDSKVIKFK